MELLREMLAQTCRFDLLEQYATDEGWEQRFEMIVENEQSSDITAYVQRMTARLNDRSDYAV